LNSWGIKKERGNIMATVDRNTGQRTTSGTLQDFSKTEVTGPQDTKTTGQTTARTTGSQSNVAVSSQLNTTPQILATLEQVIQQMFDRPAISDAEAMRQFPNAKAVVPRSGPIYFVDPLTGITLHTPEAFNQLQADKRKQIQDQAGIVKGGTSDQRAIADARQEEISRDRALQSQFSPEAARATAEGLSSYFARVLSEQELPAILRSAEGAGTSKGTTRALLTQQAIQRTGETASKVGADLTSQFGQISTQLANVLENLTKQDPNSIANQLINAIAQSKGITQSGVTSQSQTTDQTVTTDINQTQQAGAKTVNTKLNVNPNDVRSQPITGFLDTGGAIQPSSLAGTGFIDVSRLPDEFANLTFGDRPNSNQEFTFFGGEGQFIE
jgi:hypothetical protein